MTIHKTVSSNHLYLPMDQPVFSEVCVTLAALESHLSKFSLLYQMNDDLVVEDLGYSYNYSNC